SANVILSLALYYSIIFVVFFFFFQAEDGIRDLYVTGVQTCALPILIRNPASHAHFAGAQDSAIRALRKSFGRSSGQAAEDDSARSEERRVGKECRSRWSTED